jgi:hypothetical protein
MAAPSRRSFLAIAGTGAAGLGVSAVAGTLTGGIAGTASPADAPPPVPDDVEGGIVAYVDDVHGGSVSLQVGSQEVVVTDPTLVARLVDAASSLRSRDA